MLLAQVKPGARFHDTRLVSSPKHHRAHIITEIVGFSHFFATHVATGHRRQFTLDEDTVAALNEIRTHPVLHANFDALVGDRIRLELVDGGVLTCVVTGIVYKELTIDGAVFSYVSAIECDKSITTTYELEQIRRIIRIGSSVRSIP